MKILIIEDEPRAANQLQLLLKKSQHYFEILEVIDSVEDAVVWFKQNPSPTLVFMDIQLADGLSFEIFNQVEVIAPIIFTTAFDQYAIQAFKVNSIDYLLKPIQERDLESALNKFKNTQSDSIINSKMMEQLLLKMQAPKVRDGILVKEGAGFVQLKLQDILYIYSEDGLTFGVSIQKRYLIDETIDALFQTLDKSQFFRINRGQVINKKSVLKIESYFNHRVKLQVSNPQEIEFIVSRPKTPLFKQWMNS